jgi:hypothetical protein
MRIYDPKRKQLLERVTLFLTPAEAKELGQAAMDLTQRQKHHHHHIADLEFKREITVAVYTPENVAAFDDESRKILDASSRRDRLRRRARAARSCS